MDLNSGGTNFSHLVKVRGEVVLNSEDIWANDEGVGPPFFTLALDGDEWPASHPYQFIPRDRACETHWIGGWLGSRASVGIVNYSNKHCTRK